MPASQMGASMCPSCSVTGLGKAVENGLRAWGPATPLGDLQEAPGFNLSQPQQFGPFGK